MAGHFYRLRMGIYAETLFRRSNRVKRERIWLQYNVMRLGSELRRSEHWSSAAGQPQAGIETMQPKPSPR
ncbi:hypothetical protein KIP88_39665 [Bradyrhizobium sp. SRL28]|uniref:hypothetical protein n=1 Tax=Bradyrhizobium sp. SRL28 TaxID=2836178 RepID=UPI001BDDF5EB|nr:hypothetical protein [Bradyrhizobium sp. SRL28]MBT1516547.1 hypothetical protein [Bradyrhizobium sp. SRL28]